VPDEAWEARYGSLWDVLAPPVDLDAYFTRPRMGDVGLRVFDLGLASFPTGRIVAADVLVNSMEDPEPLSLTVPPGEYPAQAAVASFEGDPRVAALRVVVDCGPVRRYVNAVTRGTDVSGDDSGNRLSYFGVDSGTAAMGDAAVWHAMKQYLGAIGSGDPSFDAYSDCFEDVFDRAVADQPEMGQAMRLLWTVPGTTYSLPIVSSGWGDGAYPVYAGLDEVDRVRVVVALFIELPPNLP